MQDWLAEQYEWKAKARAAGPGYRVLREQEVLDDRGTVVFHFRLLEPGEEPPDWRGVAIEQ